MKTIIGLGNPGKKYASTRHSIGFRVVDALAAELGLKFELNKKLHAEIAKRGDLILAKPQTFMNESGLAVKALTAYYSLPAADVLIIRDEIDFPFGKIKLSTGGSAGHKLKEVMDAGVLTPYWVASYVYLKTLFNIPESENVIFDGTSRTVPEAEIVAESLTWLGRPFFIFHLGVPDDEVHTRIALRRETGSRPDDHAHIVHKRLEEYYSSTEGAIDYLRQAGLLTEIDGHRPIEVIAAEVRSILKI